MNLLYATTGSINTAALISTERKQRLRSEKKASGIWDEDTCFFPAP